MPNQKTFVVSITRIQNEEDPDFIPLVIAGIAFTATEVAGGALTLGFCAFWVTNPPNINVPDYMFRPGNVFSPSNPNAPKPPKNKLPTDKDFLLVALGAGAGCLIFKEGPGQSLKELYQNPQFKYVADVLQERLDHQGFLVLPSVLKGERTVQRILLKSTYALAEERNVTLINEGHSWTRISEITGGGIHRIQNYELTSTEKSLLHDAQRAMPIKNFRNVPTIRTIGGGGGDDGDDGDDDYGWQDPEEEVWDGMTLEALGEMFRKDLASCQLKFTETCRNRLARLLQYIWGRFSADKKYKFPLKDFFTTVFGNHPVPITIYLAWCYDGFIDYGHFMIFWIPEGGNPTWGPDSHEEVACHEWVKTSVLNGILSVTATTLDKDEVAESAKLLQKVWGEGFNWKEHIKNAPYIDD